MIPNVQMKHFVSEIILIPFGAIHCNCTLLYFSDRKNFGYPKNLNILRLDTIKTGSINIADIRKEFFLFMFDFCIIVLIFNIGLFLHLITLRNRSSFEILTGFIPKFIYNSVARPFRDSSIRKYQFYIYIFTLHTLRFIKANFNVL